MKDWCLKCGKELPYSKGEWPPGFPNICPNCGAKVQDAIKSSSTEGQTGTHRERGKKSTFPSLPVLIIAFIFSLFWIYASGLSDASYILYALLGILALYWVYKEGEEERKYVKYIAYFSILFSIFIILSASSLSSIADVHMRYGRDVAVSYYMASGYELPYELVVAALIFEALIVMAFGILLWMHVRSKEGLS